MPTTLMLVALNQDRDPTRVDVSADVTDEQLHDVQYMRDTVSQLLNTLLIGFVPELEHMTLRGHLKAAGMDPNRFAGIKRGQ